MSSGIKLYYTRICVFGSSNRQGKFLREMAVGVVNKVMKLKSLIVSKEISWDDVVDYSD